MTNLSTRRKATAATVGAAVLLSTFAAATVSSSASAAPARSATTSVDTTYLTDTLGLPADTIVETVTYDRFQWLLQQPGQFAYIVGSASDAGFPAKVVAADAAAKAAGAAKLYWYDPNLSGLTGIRNLDTRNPAGINIAAASQTVYGNTWKNLLGQYLGNGIKSVAASSSSVTITADDSVVNDSVDPLFDYRSTSSPAVSTTDDVFFVYDKDGTTASVADKILGWKNLSTDDNVASSVTSILAAAGGGGVIDQLSQFEWWKSAANAKHDLSYRDDARYGSDPLTDTDNTDGWRIKQVTYPELLHLLNVKDSADTNFALLFGGTWCHNTRAVLSAVNQEAQENDVSTVYNFDLVLDGGNVNGTNGGANPLHVRDNANSGSTFNFRPSYIYGDVVRTYFKNLVTEYDPNTGTRVSYFPGGDLSLFPDVVRKLQVPFVINYQRGTGTNPSSTAVKRQWIQQNTDASTGLPTFREYMTEVWYSRPSAQLGLNFAIPTDESTLTSAQQLQLSQARSGAEFAADGLAKLDAFFGGLPGGVVSTQTVTAPAVAAGGTPTINVAIANNYGRIPTGSVTLTYAGGSIVEPVTENAASFTLPVLAPGVHDFTLTYPGDAQIAAFTKSGSVAVNKVVSTQTLSAPSVTYGTAPKVTATIGGTHGLTATGNAVLTLSGKYYTVAVSANAAKFTLPKLAPGTYTYSVKYAGNSQFASFAKTGSLVVKKAAVRSVAGASVKKPTTKVSGAYKVAIAAPSGLTAATGKVTVTLKKGSSVSKITGTLKSGVVTIKVPKRAKGTWKVSIAYSGDAKYSASTQAAKSIVVTK